MNKSTLQETKEFQAEVKQLLGIVINSLYTDREIFLRELISNANDALEKLRFIKLTGEEINDKDMPLEISISTDNIAHTLTIRDTGIGMTKNELVENLGTIARSGSREFLKHILEGNKDDINLIGQFGVGFYSAFMVAERIELYTQSCKKEAAGCKWESEGAGTYTIADAQDLQRGTKIILHLKEEAYDFGKEETIKSIIKQYSSFVPYPIKVNGEKVNTVQALWTKNKNEISEEQYTEFYKYIANAFDEPLYCFHFSSDAPLSINALLFVPKDNFERYGFGRMEPGINLYCKKVLIQEKSKDIVPEWLRFVKGVIDSEELPLNISRETMQDSALVSKLRRVVTTRFIKYLNEQAEKDKEKYKIFWDKFGMFMKEGAATDFTHREELVKLLRFQSSKAGEGELVSLDEYLSRCKEEQLNIYYINGPSKKIIEVGPYLEYFRDKDIEVLYTQEAVDDYIFIQLGAYRGKKLVSLDQADVELPGLKEKEQAEDALTEDEIKELAEWLKQLLGEKVVDVRGSKRLVDSPAVVLSPGSSYSMQRVMQIMDKDKQNALPSILEINGSHIIIKRLNDLRKKEDPFAETAAEQIFVNAQIAAGLVVDPGSMVARSYAILEKALS